MSVEVRSDYSVKMMGNGMSMRLMERVYVVTDGILMCCGVC